LEKHYHHWLTNDEHILSLAREINHNVLIRRPKTSVYVHKEMYQLDSPATVLTFPKLTWLSGCEWRQFGTPQIQPVLEPLEKINAANFLRQTMGKNAYQLLWSRNLKIIWCLFSDISLAWFWARINKRTPSLAYPEVAFGNLLSMVTTIEKRGGTFS